MKFWEKLVFAHIIILGLVFAFLVPPYQKPDEQGHFKRAYYLSRGYIFLFNDGKKLPLDRQLDALLNDKTLNRLPNHPERKIHLPDLHAPAFAKPGAFQPVYQQEKLMFIWGPIAYIPQAIGIGVARLLHLNAYLTFYAGRAAIFVFSLAMMLWLYKRTRPPYRYLLLAVFVLPMTIHQLTAYSYDAVHLLLGCTVFSLLTDMVAAAKVSRRQLVLFGLTLVLFMAAKLSYEPLLLSVFVIPWRKIAGSKSAYFRTVIVWIVLVIGAYFLLTWPTYVSSATYTGNPPGVNPGTQVQFILYNPLTYLKTFIVSSLALAKFHLQGMIGIFGWLDYSLDPWMYGVYLLAAAIMLWKLNILEKERLSWLQVVVLAAIIFTNYAFIMTVFYLNWKTVGNSRIDGTQGRYFLVFVPYIFYLLLQVKRLWKK